MTYLKHGHTMQVNPFSLFLVYTVLALGIVATISFTIGHGVQAMSLTPMRIVTKNTIVAPKVYGTLPVAKTIPVTPTAVVVVPIVKKITMAAPLVKPVQAQMRLHIPRIGVDAVVRQMGETSDGAMAVPDNATDVGWYGLGTTPGDIGSAVIGGHSSWETRASIFANLDQLMVGDIVSITNASGVLISFVVREMRTFAATDTESGIFESPSGAHLNLITCSGAWDPAINTYATRLVVFTDLIDTPPTIAVVSDPVI